MSDYKQSEIHYVDKLTKLNNISTAQTLIKRYILKKPVDEICYLLAISIDNLPPINDIYGHMFGDAVIKDVAAIFRNVTEKSDIIARVNGVEFVIFLSQTDKKVQKKLQLKFVVKLEKYMSERIKI